MSRTGALPRMGLALALGIVVALASASALAVSPEKISAVEAAQNVTLGPRPLFLIQDMDEGTQRERQLKETLMRCAAGTEQWQRRDFSIGHRGAAMQFPEHTRESYLAAAQMGAGIVECDVTFTEDKALVCRHSQCDLHATTNILETELADQCSVPPAFDPETGALTNAEAIQCCTSDITVSEFKSLEGRMDGVNTEASSLAGYLDGTPGWRTDLYATRGTLMTHAESIELFRSLGVRMTPELKAPGVPMPFDGMSQADYAQKMIDEYKDAGVAAEDVFPQSFNLDDVRYWIDNAPEFAGQAVYLDGRYDDETFDHRDPASWSPSMDELAEQGVKILAPPMWMLLEARPEAGENEERIVPSVYAERAKTAGLELIAWTFERSGPLSEDGEWYHQSVDAVVDNEGDKLLVLDVLAKDVGIMGLFSDWPATVTLYDNCLDPEPAT
ncbi:glycerophosphodiester phosphodiesterase family protein [Halomonas saccharevitans]|uniref:glycerophosphodiester phosphodiesterase n=1 Tax=Halomonas saccharevitans TaxID=416872 RepID=A0ABU3NE56_9GAMM|nr:glycerophosphodiester phosphodiesterase family protein [Halomonas saccharevitans]MDT8879469.1 glycerophosphodiester phosphodiesterase family protein [Halomonas saccharevitans]